MIQFNLLPDVKLEYIRARKTKRTVMSASLLVAGGLLAILALLFINVNVFQKRHISNLDKDIQKNTAELKATPDLDKILTVQNQLQSLPALHDQKPVASRLFDYLIQLTPANASISHLNVDFSANTVIVSGAADTLETVNKFVDTVKFTKYTVNDDTEQKQAFSDVVLKSFARDDKGATYEINFSFDTTIFDNTNTVKLVVPKIITTRSETEKPNVLLQTNTPLGL